MMIGVDLDNTLICYDALFHRLGREMGDLPSNIPIDKTAIRNWFRANGQEDIWTQMQAHAYGDRILGAQAFLGAVDTLLGWQLAGHHVAIVSHKTRTPYSGPMFDLHSAARKWLEVAGLSGVPAYLEETRSGKIDRIARLQCTAFIDDLPEFLFDPLFPDVPTRILFDPNGNFPSKHNSGIIQARSWSDVRDQIEQSRN
ncbi:MAG: haloacid dehalogenase-like hydrolase [Alphaproteobacteria bacterium]|nr:haloacid dehalogenase-like hydrolase [Alphaproteobacteria bacterium]